MIPESGSDKIKIPITFDAGGIGRLVGSVKKISILLTFGVWLFLSIVVILGADRLSWRILYPLCSFIVMVTVVRYLIVHEYYYKRKREELIANDFLFDHNVFWDIYEIGDVYPYVVQFNNNMKGIFIAFDKDVIVGKLKDAEYYHYEAIALAYKQMVDRGIECIHIDYMDTVGKDTRMASLFKNASSVENGDLRKVLLRLYDHIDETMNRAFASYDVYCFYYSGDEGVFWSELQVVLSYFSQANYLRQRALDKNAVSELVKSVMNIEEFSVNRACDSLYSVNSTTGRMRVIWVERNGERKILAKTLDEVKEVKRVYQAEKEANKTRGGLFRKRGVQDDEEIDLFDD